MGQAFGDGGLRLTGVTDDALITRCLVHDEEAWRLLIDRYTSYIYSIAIRGFRIGAEEAREVVQESLLKLFEGLRGYRGEGQFRAWLRQIVRNCCLAYLRRRRVTEVLADTLPDRDQEETFERIERAYVLREAVRGLDESCREMIVLFFFQDRSYKDIAAALAIPQGTVASRLARCMAKLRSRMGERSTMTPAPVLATAVVPDLTLKRSGGRPLPTIVPSAPAPSSRRRS